MIFKNVLYFLSNMCPCIIYSDDGRTIYRSVEHAYQACKTIIKKEREVIVAAKDGYEAKRLAKSITIRPDWEEIKEKVMLKALRRKFLCGSEFGYKLIRISEPIVEENTWGDIYWGVCNGIGENRLGVLLTRVRKEIIFCDPMVVNNKQPSDVYVGRGMGGIWGNPYALKGDYPGTILVENIYQCLAMYEAYLFGNKKLMQRLPELGGRVLGCYCSPSPCHGHILARLANPNMEIVE